MNIKELIKTKTFWAGLIEVIGGISVIVVNGDNAGGVEQIIGGLLAALGLSILCLRDALSKKK